jgi:hypothetical protein
MELNHSNSYNFPAKTRSPPSSACGFNYKKSNSLLLNEAYGITNNSNYFNPNGIPTTTMMLQIKPNSTMMKSTSSLLDAQHVVNIIPKKSTLKKQTKVFERSLNKLNIERKKNGSLDELSFTESHPLLSSFGANSCYLGLFLLHSSRISFHVVYLGIDKRKSVGTQTDEAIIKKEFADMKEYRAWGAAHVDPFLKVFYQFNQLFD